MSEFRYVFFPGFALGLTTHDADNKQWDFDDQEMRGRAWAKVRSEQPLLLIGSLSEGGRSGGGVEWRWMECGE